MPSPWPFRSAIPEREDFPTSTEFLAQVLADPAHLTEDTLPVFLEARRLLAAKIVEVLDRPGRARATWGAVLFDAAEAARYPGLLELYEAWRRTW